MYLGPAGTGPGALTPAMILQRNNEEERWLARQRKLRQEKEDRQYQVSEFRQQVLEQHLDIGPRGDAPELRNEGPRYRCSSFARLYVLLLSETSGCIQGWGNTKRAHKTPSVDLNLSQSCMQMRPTTPELRIETQMPKFQSRDLNDKCKLFTQFASQRTIWVGKRILLCFLICISWIFINPCIMRVKVCRYF